MTSIIRRLTNENRLEIERRVLSNNFTQWDYYIHQLEKKKHMASHTGEQDKKVIIQTSDGKLYGYTPIDETLESSSIDVSPSILIYPAYITTLDGREVITNELLDWDCTEDGYKNFPYDLYQPVQVDKVTRVGGMWIRDFKCSRCGETVRNVPEPSFTFNRRTTNKLCLDCDIKSRLYGRLIEKAHSYIAEKEIFGHTRVKRMEGFLDSNFDWWIELDVIGVPTTRVKGTTLNGGTDVLSNVYYIGNLTPLYEDIGDFLEENVYYRTLEDLEIDTTIRPMNDTEHLRNNNYTCIEILEEELVAYEL